MSQAQMFNRVGLFLVNPVFSDGQLFVSSSRVRNFNSIKVFVQDIEHGSNRQGKQTQFGEGVFSKNVVYREVF